MKIYVSAKANKELLSYLKQKGYELCLVGRLGGVSPAVDCHPDIYFCLLNEGIYEGDASLLTEGYPGEVLYNAAALGPYLICSRYTSTDLIEASGLEPVIVRQGYVKCNMAVLDDTHVITEDEGIAKVLRKLGTEVLLLKTHEVRLEGHEYGFIGGACGRVGKEMIFSGDLSAHSCFEEIRGFCRACGLECVYFTSYPLTDIGSILAFGA